MNIHNFYIGKSFDAYKYFGAHLSGKSGEKGSSVTFRTYAPNAEKVCVEGDFSDWKEIEMLQDELSGIYEAVSFHAKYGDMYKYVIYTKTGARVEHCDPYGFQMELRPGFASIIADLNYRFSDSDWIKKRTNCFDKPLNIYEIHAGSWKMKAPKAEKGKTKIEDLWYNYEELIPLLIPYLKEGGYTHVEFMPLSEHPFDGSWGYQNTGFFAPTSRYGSPIQLKKLINALHKAGIGAILDIVPVHFASDYYALKEYDGTKLYEHPADDVGNSEWGTCNFGYNRGEVCSFIQSFASFWIEEYHFDGLRMDAISNAIYWMGNSDRGVNEQAVEFLKEMNSDLHRLHPGIIIAAEDSTSFPNVTKPVEEGGLGFDYKWDMGWMNDTLSYFKSYPWARKDLSKMLTFSMMYFYSEKFILPFSHDENVHGKATIMQKMEGEYEYKFPQGRALYMYQLMHPGKKLNFMGYELAQLREWTEEQEQDWMLLKYPLHDSFRKYIFKLNEIYKKYDALWYDYDPTNFEWADLNNTDSAIYSIYRKSADYVLLAVFNLNGMDRFDYQINVKGKPELLLCSDFEEFSGKSKNDSKFFYTEKLPNSNDWMIKFKVPAFSGTLFKINLK